MSSPTAPADAALSWPEAVRDALGILAVDGLEVDAETRVMLDRIAREEITPQQAVDLMLVRYSRR